MTIYFDNAATTALDPEIIELMNKLNQELYGNPSSLHSQGRAAKKQLEQARKTIAQLINAEVEEIVFTSGATESNNFVFKNLDYDLIITSPTEHASVLEPAKASGKDIIWLNLNQEGYIDQEELEQAIKANSDKKILVSIMHANNEIGTLQELEAISKITENHSNVILHSDCVQTFAKYDLSKINLDLLSASAHKIHGPKGVGFLYIRKGLIDSALITGGGQEQDLRSGTENLVSIIAFAKATELMQNNSKQQELHNYLFDSLKDIEGLVINGPRDKRLLGNCNISLSNCKLNSEELVLQMDLKGIAISSGSACSSNKGDSSIQSSYVLRACRVEEAIAAKAIRISLSRFNTKEEIDLLVKIIKELPREFPTLVSKASILG